ncbi:XkdW family protein [Paenibacillus zanthoxyli]|uniref:XkdW family protein n=1 Tax=Paenibacillus zanthoxyli TaxID=369399 RepID=UPI0004715058|nr:XkdW family protein [Paenibacillus zanthoxyli]
MDLYLAIKHIFPSARVDKDFALLDKSDGKGPYIAVWNLEAPQPTEEELLAAWEAYQLEDHPQPKNQAEEIAELKQLVADLASLQLGV